MGSVRGPGMETGDRRPWIQTPQCLVNKQRQWKMWAKSVMHLRLSGLGVGITDKVKEVGRVGLSRPVTRTSVTYLS